VNYEWYFDGEESQSTDANPTYTFKEKGVYTVRLVVSDEDGKQTITTTEVRAGNALPEVTLDVDGNRSFYWDNKTIRYSVDVKDAEDGSLGNGVRESDVSVNLTYSTMGTDMTMVEQSEETFTSTATGWQLMKDSDCKACHALNDKSVGPSYLQIAARYPNEKANVEKLASKIISGGSGSWGENVMSAHPQLSRQQAQEMVSFILSLRDDAQATRPLPVKGSFRPDNHLKDKTTGDYVLTVSFKDKPVSVVGSNQVRKRIVFKHPLLNAVSAGKEEGVTKSVGHVSFNEDGAWIMFQDVDLTDIKSVRLLTSSQLLGGKLTLRIGSPDGAEIGSVSIAKDHRKPEKNSDGETEYHWQAKLLPLKEQKGIYDIYVVFEDESGSAEEANGLLLRSIEFKL
jgi:cytochrome c